MLEQLWAWAETLKPLGVWGHLLTFLLSVFTTTLFFARYIATSRAEIRRLRLETRNQNLLGARLACYKECFALLSEFQKVTFGYRDGRNEHRSVTVEELSTLNAALSNWNSAHALLLSGDAGGRFYLLRGCIRDLLRALQLAGQDELLAEKRLYELVRHIHRVELALKTDIGVFAVDEFLALSRPKNYAQVENLG
jgi:hypothetical protein